MLHLLERDQLRETLKKSGGRFGRVRGTSAAPSGAFGAPLSAVGGDASSADVISLSSYTNSVFSVPCLTFFISFFLRLSARRLFISLSSPNYSLVL